MDMLLIWYMWTFGFVILALLFLMYQRIQHGIRKAIAKKADLLAESEKFNLEFVVNSPHQNSPTYNFSTDFFEKVAGMPARLSGICSRIINRQSLVTITLHEKLDWDFINRDLYASPGWRMVFMRNGFGYAYPDDLPSMSILAGAKYFLINDLANPVGPKRRWRSGNKNDTGSAAVYGSLLCLPIYRTGAQYEIIGLLHIYAGGIKAFDPLVDVTVLQMLTASLSQTVGTITNIISANRRPESE